MKILAAFTCFESPYHGVMGIARWLQYYLPHLETLGADEVWLINDGPFVPPDYVLNSGSTLKVIALSPRLGRPSIHVLPGYYRSFIELMRRAAERQAESVTFVEWDYFIMSQRLMEWLGEQATTTTRALTLWTEHYGMPEIGINIVPRNQYEAVIAAFAKIDHSVSSEAQQPELIFPWQVYKNFIGDRYPEWGAFPPDDADWIANLPLGNIVEFGTRKITSLPALGTPARFQYQGLQA